MILLIETDAGLSSSLQAMLQEEGFAFQATSDAKGCVELTRLKRPSLILMGIELGGGQNGYILCGRLKKDEQLKDIPLVLYGSPDGFGQHQKLKTRADGYVAKPIERDNLLQELRCFLQPEEPSPPQISEQELQLEDFIEATFTEETRLEGQDAWTDAGPEFTDGGAHAVEPPIQVDTESPLALTQQLTEHGGWNEEGTSPGLPALKFPPASTDDGELEALRRRVQQLEEEASQNQTRLSLLYQRLRTEEAAREKARKALQVALQLLEGGPVQLPSDKGEANA